jgi:hypothetical protein
MNWESRSDDDPPTWVVDELAGRLSGVGVAVRISTGKIIAGGLEDLAVDGTTLTLVGSTQAFEIQSEAVVAYALLDAAIDHSDELRGDL